MILSVIRPGSFHALYHCCRSCRVWGVCDPWPVFRFTFLSEVGGSYFHAAVQADQREAVTSELRPAHLMWCSDEDRKTTSRSAPTGGQKQRPWDLRPHLQVHRAAGCGREAALPQGPQLFPTLCSFIRQLQQNNYSQRKETEAKLLNVRFLT